MMTDGAESRKDATIAESPVLGGRTVLAITALLVLQAGLLPLARSSSLLEMILLGLIWCGWASSLWVIVRQPLRIWRAVALGLSLAWHCLMLTARQTYPVERYLIMLACYGSMQTVTMVLLNLPQWTFAGQSRRRAEKMRFGILAVLVLTTGIAILMAAATRYASQVGDSFFSGLVLFMASLLFTFVVVVVLSTSKFPRLFGTPLVIATSLVSASLMVAVEAVSGVPRPANAWWDLLTQYGIAASVFGVAAYIIGSCGHADAC